MCLLHTHHADTEFDYNDIQDFYMHNQDGIGVMYVENGEVVVKKFLPKDSQEAWAIYQEHIKGRECATHWRMKTHGLIDMENCHPYHVVGNVYLMHNGVLSTGNDKDRTKSDTWHYARDYLAPLLLSNPSLIREPAFQKMLGAHIGQGNRFALMDEQGLVIINEHHGTTYKGAWLSNTSEVS